MGSLNPVILLPAALAARAAEIGRAFAASLTLGTGQFCTNPGLILALPGPGLDNFVEAAASALAEIEVGPMLSPGIAAAYRRGTGILAAQAEILALGSPMPGRERSGLFAASAQAFRDNPLLREEVFGPASLILRCRDLAEMAALLEELEGQLSAALHLAPEDHPAARVLLPILERKAGRILVNGFGTGVEVCRAMVHGGPYPATSDGRSTSVGTLAIARFLRPVCYQDLPPELLPAALRD
jgi:NADP-dependent aldehyde dehydrogenase